MKVVTFIILFSSSVLAETYFVKEAFTHLFEFKSENASYSQTLSCGTPVEIIEKNIGWSMVKFNQSVGYVGSSSLAQNNPECFHEKYPVFYESLNIDSADLFYWGKLGGKL